MENNQFQEFARQTLYTYSQLSAALLLQQNVDGLDGMEGSDAEQKEDNLRKMRSFIQDSRTSCLGLIENSINNGDDDDDSKQVTHLDEFTQVVLPVILQISINYSSAIQQFSEVKSDHLPPNQHLIYIESLNALGKLMKFLLMDTLSSLLIAVVEESAIGETSKTVLGMLIQVVAHVFDQPDMTVKCIEVLGDTYASLFCVFALNVSPINREDMKRMWEIVGVLKQRIDQGFDMLANQALCHACVQFLAIMVYVQSKNTAASVANSNTIDLDNISIDIIPASHPFMSRESLSLESRAVLNRFLLFLGTTVTTRSWGVSYITAVLNAVYGVVKFRAVEYGGPVVRVVLDFHSKIRDTMQQEGFLSSFAIRSVARTIKVWFLGVYSLEGLEEFEDEVEQRLIGVEGVGVRELQAKQRIKRDARKRSAEAAEAALTGGIVSRRRKRLQLQLEQRVQKGLPEFAPAPHLLQQHAQVAVVDDSLSFAQEVEMALEIIGLGVHTFPTDIIISGILNTLNSRTEDLLQKDIEGFLIRGGGFDPTYRANNRRYSYIVPADITARIDVKEEETGLVATGQRMDLQMDEVEAILDACLDVDSPLNTLIGAFQRILGMDSFFGAGGGMVGGGAKKSSLVGAGGFLGGIDVETIGSARNGWMVLISRTLTRSPHLSLNTDDSTKILKELLVEFCVDEFSKRMDLAIFWLYEEYLCVYRDILNDGTNGARNEFGYSYWLEQFLKAMRGDDPIAPSAVVNDFEMNATDEASQVVKKDDAKVTSVLKTGLDVKDRIYTRFLVEVPELTQFALDHVYSYCKDEKRLQLGIATLRDLCIYRPAVREKCLNWLFEFAVSLDRILRAHSCVPLKRFITHPAIGPIVLQFANDTLATLFKDTNPEVNTLSDDEISSKLELYLTLCMAQPDTLIPELFSLVFKLPSRVFKILGDGCVTVFNMVPPSSIIGLISTFPAGSEELALVLIKTLLKKEDVSVEVIEKTRLAVIEKDLDVRFLELIITSLDKENVLHNIGKIVSSLKDDDPSRSAAVANIFKELTQIRQGLNDEQPNSLITPAELMIRLHNLEDSIGLKMALEATNICFSMPDIFKQEVLAIVLTQLSSQPRLPTLFMRTVIQSLNTFKGLGSFVNGILTRLAGKQIWRRPKLWEGFIRILALNFPSSMPILLALPKPQGIDVLVKNAVLSKKLQDYLDELGQAQKVRQEFRTLSLLIKEAATSSSKP